MLKTLHVAFAWITVVGFVARAGLAFAGSSLRRHKFVKIAPHVIDSALLVVGLLLAWQLALSPLSGWLGAKLLGLLAYIGFGVLTLRAPGNGLRAVGAAGALAAIGYVFAVAFSRQPWPF